MDHTPKTALGWVRFAIERIAPGGLQRAEKWLAEKDAQLDKEIAESKKRHERSRTYGGKSR